MDPLLNADAPFQTASPGARSLRVVWERALDLAVEVFRLEGSPSGLDPELCQRMRCAALEVPTCLARALGRGSPGLRGQLIVALGALGEIESHLALASRVNPAPGEKLADLRQRLRIVRRLIIELGVRQREADAGAARSCTRPGAP